MWSGVCGVVSVLSHKDMLMVGGGGLVSPSTCYHHSVPARPSHCEGYLSLSLSRSERHKTFTTVRQEIASDSYCTRLTPLRFWSSDGSLSESNLLNQ